MGRDSFSGRRRAYFALCAGFVAMIGIDATPVQAATIEEIIVTADYRERTQRRQNSQRRYH